MAKSPKEPTVPVEELEVLERHDPSVDGVTDGDPTFDMMLNPDTVPEDRHPVWVHFNPDPKQDATGYYRARGYRVARAEDGIQMLSGMTFNEGEPITYADHQLMLRDRATHERQTARERYANRKTREAMLSKKRTTGDIFVSLPGDGPRAMHHRG